MTRFMHITAACLYAVVAAASLVGLAAASGDTSDATLAQKAEGCKTAVCFVTLF